MDNEKPLAETITEIIQEKLIAPINDTLKTVMQFGEAPPSENVVDLLKADHRKVESLFKEFENAEGKADKVSILKTILEELTLHTIAEEKLVYSRIGESSDEDEQEKVHEAFEEHEAAQNLISQLSNFTGDEENFEAKVKLLEEMIKHHVTEEELDLLPKLDESREELEELGREFQDEKDDLKDQHAKFEPPAEKPEPVMHKTRKSTARSAKRPAAKKAAPKRGAKTAAKSTAKKSPARKTAEKRSESKAPAKKTATKKASTKKAVAKRGAARTGAKKSSATAKKSTVGKSASKKTTSTRKTSSKTGANSKRSASRSTSKKTEAKKTGGRKTTAKKTAKKTPASRKSAAKPRKASAASAKKATTTKKATVKKPAASSKRKKASNRKSKAA